MVGCAFGAQRDTDDSVRGAQGWVQKRLLKALRMAFETMENVKLHGADWLRLDKTKVD